MLVSILILVFGCLLAIGVLVFVLASLATGVRAGESPAKIKKPDFYLNLEENIYAFAL